MHIMHALIYTHKIHISYKSHKHIIHIHHTSTTHHTHSNISTRHNIYIMQTSSIITNIELSYRTLHRYSTYTHKQK